MNALDFNAVATNFGSSGKYWQDGDFTYDGNVDTLDFTMMARNFNQSIPVAGDLLGPALGTLVPEPASIILIAAAGAFGFQRRRRMGR